MSQFDYFVVLAEMRTGSNFLETNLNALDGVICFGEAFNPHFIGYPKSTDMLGVTREERDADPLVLLARIREGSEGLRGFRYFNDHDPRIFDTVLADPRCAKIILTRNPAESFVSWKIAAATGQWKLTNAKKAKSEQVHFDGDAFEDHLQTLQAFQIRLLNALQRSGQAAFYLAYEDLQDLAVMNGLAAYLGIEARLSALKTDLKKQNPQPMHAKVTNFDEMEQVLARLDRFNLNRAPNFEPRRGAPIPNYLAAPRSPLLYMPIRCGPEAQVQGWLSALDGGAPLLSGFTPKSLAEWQRAHAGHRSFTVLRHPLARAHTAFCTHILPTGPGSFLRIRRGLLKIFHLPLPELGPNEVPDDRYFNTAHREAFLAFLQFLKANLSGQTGFRVDQTWASQLSVMQGMAQFGLPDMVIREERLEPDLAFLATQIGIDDVPTDLPVIDDPHLARLRAIYDPEIEAAARDAYPRDYTWFGFGDWGVQAA